MAIGEIQRLIITVLICSRFEVQAREQMESTTEQSRASATKQYAAGGIAMVIDNNELLSSISGENKSEAEISELRAEERIRKTRDTGSRAYVAHTGDIYWPPVKRYKSSCNIDITYFPFDDQICYLKLGSWSYDGFQVNIWNKMATMDMTHALKNSEFEVIDSKIKRFITYYDCCIEPYPDIKVYIHIRRQTIQHIFNIVIPCITLSIICMVGFLIPPDKNDEKISVQLTVLFSLSLFMLLVADSTPRTSETVPLISIYLTALICITAMSTTAHVVCDKLVASAKVRGEVSYLANKLIYKLMQCCQKQEDSEQVPSIVIETETNDNSGSDDDSSHVQEPLNDVRSIKPLNRNRRGHSLSVLHEGRTLPSSSAAPKTTPLNNLAEEGLQGMFQHLKVRQDKIRKDLHDTAKWYKIATKMDRIFFWSYGISMLILTFYAFVFKPMQKDLKL
ncbi:acetylcholine receptor subunit alpha-type acr-16-like [Watersipora subatra]|uniref:acetylcholine receptor subunit alpha-type acr-16-like n=1 Tax=Watersipora subatra TaxID=2589382 RepID=UPI00355B8B97